MKIKEAISQLEDLRKDRESFVDLDEIFAKDIEAIDAAVEVLKERQEIETLLQEY